MTMRTINPAGLALVKEFEGFRSNAYLCPAGVWTVGYGHTEGVKPGDFVSLEQASQMLADDLAAFGQGVDALLTTATSDNEFAALVSLAYNIGLGGFRGSSALRLHNAGKKAEAADAILAWNKATVNGALTVLDGLTRRRKAERALYLGAGEAPAPKPAGVYRPVILKPGALGQNVRNLQAALNGAGITPPLVTDGSYGPRTEAAVKEFQKLKHLAADGIAGPRTLEALGL